MKNGGSLSKEQFLVLNSLYNVSRGRSPIFSDIRLNRAMEKSRVMRELISLGYADAQFERITPEGLRALEPYRVSGAVIMAAGPSTRCIPLSLEQPKGLFCVKGERLIDRQISQLREAGISDITVVLGYKKEMFFYLRGKYGVRLIENDDYLLRNNVYSLYLAKDYLRGAYICSCDDYFVENPFNAFEYESFCAGLHFDRPADEMYVYIDEDGRIVKMREQLDKGLALLGHSFWKPDFADAFVACAETVPDAYEKPFWEWLVKDSIDDFPPFFFKRYAPGSIVELDYFDDLRRFDSAYVKNANSKIIQNILSVFGCAEDEITDFRNISEGLTNTSFIFRLGGVDYIYRHPGDGTEKLISRRNEKTSLELAKKYGIDPTFVHIDIEEGWKISELVADFREPDYSDFGDSQKVAAMLRRLHALPVTVDYGLRPWEDALVLARNLEERSPGCTAAYAPLQEKIRRLYEQTQGDGVEQCFCHGDTYKHNWMLKSDGTVILIDWEYSGMSDPGVDVGYYIVDAQYDFPAAEAFIAEYLGGREEKKLFHFMAYTAIIAYYWFLWAMYRESCGAVIGESLTIWRDMAYKYADWLLP